MKEIIMRILSKCFDHMPEVKFVPETDHEKILKHRLINMMMDNREHMNYRPLFIYKENKKS